MKKLLKKITPKILLKTYHYGLAVGSAWIYGRPTRKLIVIGVTGTKGKTTATNYIWSALSHSGIKTGTISSANIRIGNESLVNEMHMTMPGRGKIQELCKKMLQAGCTHVVTTRVSSLCCGDVGSATGGSSSRYFSLVSSFLTTSSRDPGVDTPFASARPKSETMSSE